MFTAFDRDVSFRYNIRMYNSIAYYRSADDIIYNHTVRDVTKKTVYQAESHSTIEVALLASGQVDYFVDGATYRTRKGDFIIMNSLTYHWSQIISSEPCERLNLHFSPNFVLPLKNLDLSYAFANTNLYQNIIPAQLVEKTKIPEIMYSFDTLINTKDKYKEAKIILLIQELIIEINAAVEILLTKEYELIPAPQSTNELLQIAMKYINAHLKETVSTKHIARELGVSESYLYHAFKNQMGVSLHTYIQNQKMHLALSLIRKGYAPQNVSDMLGFDYYNTFFNQFKTVFGKSPSQFG